MEANDTETKSGGYVRVVRVRSDRDVEDDWILTYWCLWAWVFGIWFVGLVLGGAAGWGTYERVWWNGVCPAAHVCSTCYPDRYV